MISRKSTDQKYNVDHQDETTSPGGGTVHVSSGGGTPDTGGGTPFHPVPAEFNHWRQPSFRGRPKI